MSVSAMRFDVHDSAVAGEALGDGLSPPGRPVRPPFLVGVAQTFVLENPGMLASTVSCHVHKQQSCLHRRAGKMALVGGAQCVGVVNS